jgi:hypothetical protein
MNEGDVSGWQGWTSLTVILTYITPDRSWIQNIVAPHDGVDQVDKVPNKNPTDTHERSNVARTPVPWCRNEYEWDCQGRKKNESGVMHGTEE